MEAPESTSARPATEPAAAAGAGAPAHTPLDGVWAPYRPDDDAPWDLQRVVHLHRRAAFGATWSEIQRDLKGDPKDAIDRILGADLRREGVPHDFARLADVIGNAAARSNDPNRLKAAWLYWIYFTPDPLAERLALMWHNHFATSNQKVLNLGLMKRQNDTFRRYARAPFGELLPAMLRDPALLVWLDSPQNRRTSPNENLGRELMELFTLGIGHYTEADVKEAARALTGWGIRPGDSENAGITMVEIFNGRDEGDKVVLGRRGNWGTDDLAKILLEEPATARRLAWRLCEQFMGERAVDDAAIDELANALREHDLDINWAVETILRSRAFFAAANLGTRVTDPVEFIAAPTRAVEWFDPPPSTLAMAEWVTRVGQDLFYPPNVGGWTGGRAWLTSRGIIARANFATALVQGELSTESEPLNLAALATRHGRGADLREAVGFFADLLLGGRLSPAALDDLTNRAESAHAPAAETLRRAVAVMLALPEAQLS
jgi:uncharacterized protein (DUF1800 family)